MEQINLVTNDKKYEDSSKDNNVYLDGHSNWDGNEFDDDGLLELDDQSNLVKEDELRNKKDD